MSSIQYTNSPGIPHQSMAEEFLCHRKGIEWWYTTGYLTDEAGKMFTYQFTLAQLHLYGLRLFFLLTALTDFETGKHYYAQQPFFSAKDVIITPERVGVNGMSAMAFSAKKLGLNMSAADYSLTLDMDAIKPPVWHCDNGVLKMGIEDNYTYYWSNTNLAVTGTLVFHGKPHRVSGKGWFDRQGGQYKFLDRRTQWEWFSLRFFDNEEVMLFSFPHDGYQDGTIIDGSGHAKRLTDYTIAPLGFTESSGFKFSSGWAVNLKGVKEQEYTIIPKVDGQLNFFFYELLADIKNKEGKVVGYCFVELLPGVYNTKSTVSAVFAKK